MRTISIEIKMILSAIFFALILVSVERYEFSQHFLRQFIESKKSKNALLINTISPIVGLNISLGLDKANQDYLSQIVKQNHDLVRFELIDSNGKRLFYYAKNNLAKIPIKNDGINSIIQSIEDPVLGEKIATIALHFDNHEYNSIIQKNREVSIKIMTLALIFLIGFIIYIRQEFKFLKRLSENVLQYDPHLNNFTLSSTDRKDEVGIIHNAIVAMVAKISAYATLLDELNQSLTLKVQERTQELEQANAQLLELSVTDSLTQLPNRRHLENHLQKIWELSKRKGVFTTIIMCDIDHFKSVNDKYGHIIGDYVLKDIAKILRNSVKRESDFVARYGGEEFLLVLYDTPIQIAEELCSNIQNTLKNMNGFRYKDITLPAVTLSFGICSIIPNESNQYYDLIHLADTALYQAKESGRNRYVSILN